MGIRYDANGDYLRRSANLPSSSDYTVMFWARLESDRNTLQCAFYRSNDAADTYVYVGTDSDGVTMHLAASYQATSDGSTTGSALTVGTWYHICLTVSGSSHIVYLNGASDMTLTMDATSGFNNDLLTFGNVDDAEQGSGFYWNGQQAAIKVWDKALTGVEVLSEMRQYVPFRTTNLNVNWPCRNVGEQGTDYSGNGRNATVGGTLATADGPPIPWRASSPRKRVYVPSAGGAYFNPGSIRANQGVLGVGVGFG